jgi:type I restriction enzyme R subunit
MTSNFGFVKKTSPTVHADCARAESYLSSDPAAACFYSRRAIEQLVGHLYDLMGLPAPYQRTTSPLGSTTRRSPSGRQCHA